MIWFVDSRDGALISPIRVDSESAYIGSPQHVSAEPPQCGEGSSPRWNGSSWECALDRRGTTWHLPGTQQVITICLLGEQPPVGWEPGPPPAPQPDQGQTIEL